MLTLLCYIMTVLIWLGVAVVRLAMDSARLPEPMQLEPQDFTTLSGIWIAPEWDEGDRRIITLDADPQMIAEFGEAGLVLTRVELRAGWSATPPGGIHLYYTTEAGQPFSERRKLWAEAGPDGGWVFDVGGRRVTAIRLDPGSAGAVTWQYDAVVLNAEKPAWAYFVPDTRGIFLLLFAPLLASAILWEASALVSPWFARRRLEREWEKRATAGK